MREKLCALSREYGMLPAGERVLCAVSGGADSMCLLHLLRELAPSQGFSLCAAHFNHRLRGAESDRDEAFVRARCREWGISLTCGGDDVAAQAARTGKGVEETARALRYAFLRRAAAEQGASRIATAHTADDNAETVLLHLVRGAGLQGLAGIPPRRGDVVRPLLTATRAEVEAYCAARGVPYVQDSTNFDEGYTRNFLRRQIMPLLKQMNPRAAEHLSGAAARLRADQDYLNALAAQAVSPARETPEGLCIEARVLAALPDPVAVRAARLLIVRAGGGDGCTAAHLEGVLRLCRGGGPSARADLPGLTARRVYGALVVSPAQEPARPPDAAPLLEGGRAAFGSTGWQAVCRRTVCPEKICKKPDIFFLSCAKIKGTPVLRTRLAGDAIRLPGRGTKSLKKLFIEAKIPRAQRALLPVLADGAGVLAAASFGPDASRLARPGEDALEIIFTREKE